MKKNAYAEDAKCEQLSHGASDEALEALTPVILTFNESENIVRTLSSLEGFSQIIVVDSGSTDGTLELVKRFPNARIIERRFDNHLNQWKFGVSLVKTRFALALDADMVVTPEFIEELSLFASSRFTSGLLCFQYWIGGSPLLGSIYPAQIRLFEPSKVTIGQRGHTQTFTVAGASYRFKSYILHDDRKGFDRWLNNQHKYSTLERNRLVKERKWTNVRDSIRYCCLGVFVWPLAGYLRAGGPFAGRAALVYAMERLIFEAILLREIIASRNSLPAASEDL
jgi:glycosyltransferase involved in cell wall biosynthesis